MTHLTVREWGAVCVSTESSINAPHAFTRPQANALLTAARAHPLANQHGTNILIDRHNKIIAGQMADVYQMMAYARLYHCPQVMLLYPHHAGLGDQPLNAGYRILAGEEQLQVASVNLLLDEDEIIRHLIHLIGINK